jgi:hypothetical protein
MWKKHKSKNLQIYAKDSPTLKCIKNWHAQHKTSTYPKLITNNYIYNVTLTFTHSKMTVPSNGSI